MAFPERVNLYSKVEKIRERPLIAFITSIRPNAMGIMASDMIPFFIKQIQAIPSDKREVDVLIISNGGDPTVAWRIMSLLRERFDKVGVLVPYAAYSAATLLALGADEIYMHPYGNLGPVDPQLTSRKQGEKDQPGSTISFSAEDLKHYLDFVKNDVGISDQEQLEKAFEFICKDIGAIPIGISKKSTNLSYSMGEKLLKLHMADQNKVHIIIEKLNSSFYHHGYPVGRKEAIEIGLQIAPLNPELDQVIWQIWEDFEEEMVCNTSYNPLEVVLKSSEKAKLLADVPQLNIPANIPPQLSQAVIQQTIQMLVKQINIEMIKPIESKLIIAKLESSRCRSECVIVEKILATRLIDTNIRLNFIPLSHGWTHYEEIMHELSS